MKRIHYCIVEINVAGIIRVTTGALRKNLVRKNVDRTNAVGKNYIKCFHLQKNWSAPCNDCAKLYKRGQNFWSLMLLK